MKPTLQMTEFDELIGSSSLQMMKAFLPFLEPSMQQWAAFYIQLQELQNAMELFQNPEKPPPWPRRACLLGQIPMGGRHGAAMGF